MVNDDKTTRDSYEAAKKELQQLLAKKRAVDRGLVNLENQIHLFEGAYLEDTIGTGNIVKGFDGYLRAGPHAATGGGGSSGHHSHGSISRRPGGARAVDENDRIFSRSSKTYTKSLLLKEKETAIANGTYVPSEDESTSVPAGSGTGTSTPAGTSDSKKKKTTSGFSSSHKKRPRSRPDSDATSDEEAASTVSKKKGRVPKTEE